MKKFENPELEIVRFHAEDVMTASMETPEGGTEDLPFAPVG